MLKPPHQPGDRHGSPHPQHRFLHPPLENVFFCASHAPWPLMGAAQTAGPAQFLWLVLARACRDDRPPFFCCRFMRRVHLSIPPQSTLTPQTPQPRSPSLLQTCTDSGGSPLNCPSLPQTRIPISTLSLNHPASRHRPTHQHHVHHSPTIAHISAAIATAATPSPTALHTTHPLGCHSAEPAPSCMHVM